MYRPFKSVEESNEYLGKEVTVAGDKAQLIQVKTDDKRNLLFAFEYPDGTTEVLNSLSAFYTVRMDGHLFGKYLSED